MKGLRATPPEAIGFPISRIRDYNSGEIRDTASGQISSTGLPPSNMLFYELADGSTAIVRPSGTEPKVKLYIMAQGADAKACDAAFSSIKDALGELVQP